jgi:hypothetical protein
MKLWVLDPVLAVYGIPAYCTSIDLVMCVRRSLEGQMKILHAFSSNNFFPSRSIQQFGGLNVFETTMNARMEGQFNT